MRLAFHPTGQPDLTKIRSLRAGLPQVAAINAHLESVLYLANRGHHNQSHRRYNQAVNISKGKP